MRDEELKIQKLLIELYNNLVNKITRINSGNLSHELLHFKTNCFFMSEYLKKYSQNELAIKHSTILNNFIEKCDYITTGNYAHNLAIIKCICNNYIKILEKTI
jgi:hypothetical protein